MSGKYTLSLFIAAAGIVLVVVLVTRDSDKRSGSQRDNVRGKSMDTISKADRQTLLTLARRSLKASVTNRYPNALTDGLRISERLKQDQGAFVTLKKHGRLRGCIGYILPQGPLYQAVINNAKNAALRDRRFRPVQTSELADIEIEISALSVPHSVPSYRDIVIGKHGIILKRNGRSATYLPHVAPEQGWDRSTALSHLSRKAGLPTTAWQDPATQFLVYEAEVWSETGSH